MIPYYDQRQKEKEIAEKKRRDPSYQEPKEIRTEKKKIPLKDFKHKDYRMA